MSGMDNTSYTVRVYTGGAGEEFMLGSDYIVIYRNTGELGAYLPPAFPGRRIEIINDSSSTVNILCQQNLDGVPGGSITPEAWAQFLSDGTNWFTMGWQ